MSKNNCDRCGIDIKDKKYNPYNTTFEQYYFCVNTGFGEHYYCFKCAKWFVDGRNKCKGGHWVLEKDN